MADIYHGKGLCGNFDIIWTISFVFSALHHRPTLTVQYIRTSCIGWCLQSIVYDQFTSSDPARTTTPTYMRHASGTRRRCPQTARRCSRPNHAWLARITSARIPTFIPFATDPPRACRPQPREPPHTHTPAPARPPQYNPQYRSTRTARHGRGHLTCLRWRMRLCVLLVDRSVPRPPPPCPAPPRLR